MKVTEVIREIDKPENPKPGSKGSKFEILSTPSQFGLQQADEHALDPESPLRYAFFDTSFGRIKTKIVYESMCRCHTCQIEADVLDFDDHVLARIKASINTALVSAFGPKGFGEFC